ncbi:MAG: hypothetical protein NT031_17870 [Planctomycetota bacterium]|nr:hypothetical protein [Planctomycetota bacterium]
MNVHWRLFHREGAKPARWVLGAMLLAGLAAYYNSFSGAFVFDDLPSIVENASIRDLGQLRTVLAPSQGGLTTSGRPVVNLSLAINYALGELNPAGYHVTNLAIHLLAGWVLFAVLRRTFLLPALGGRFARDAAPLAAAVTAIWLVHPIQAEAVTYVIQRAESLVTLFYLLTLYGAIRLATASRSEGWCTAAAAACAAGMATKEVMVSAPLLVLLYDRAFLAGSFRRALACRWRLYLALGATWAILAYLMFAARGRGGTAGFGIDVSWWQYARSQFGVIVHYLKLCVWPDRLCLDYAWPVATTWQEIVPPALIVAVLLGACVWALVRRAAWGVPAALFFLALAPTSSVVPIRDPGGGGEKRSRRRRRDRAGDRRHACLADQRAESRLPVDADSVAGHGREGAGEPAGDVQRGGGVFRTGRAALREGGPIGAGRPEDWRHTRPKDDRRPAGPSLRPDRPGREVQPAGGGPGRDERRRQDQPGQLLPPAVLPLPPAERPRRIRRVRSEGDGPVRPGAREPRGGGEVQAVPPATGARLTRGVSSGSGRP